MEDRAELISQQIPFDLVAIILGTGDSFEDLSGLGNGKLCHVSLIYSLCMGP